MAIYHCSMKPIGRAGGRSAVAAAAYRAGDRLENRRDGLVHDYTAKAGVVQAEIVLPAGVEAAWALDRSALWNAAEVAEKRKDARVAREFEIALPHELSPEQHLAATREFARGLARRTGAAVDFAIHRPHAAGDQRNHHAHVLVTTRRVGPEGLGEKTDLERENKWLLAQGRPTTDAQLREIRASWEGIVNRHLAAQDLDLRIDHRSHAERGVALAPTEHVGVYATGMQRRGLAVTRAALDAQAAARNAVLIAERPEEVLTLITHEKSVFDRRDIARALHRALPDDAPGFQNALATVLASPALVTLQPEHTDAATGVVTPARYATRAMVALEAGMVAASGRLQAAGTHGVTPARIAAAMARQDAAIQGQAGDPAAGLSPEQRAAIRHVTGPERIAAVVGFAGAGKSTMLAAAREAWEAQGYRVLGAALSGKAAEGLEESSGIPSRTLASWSLGWERDRGRLGRGDVFVIDEAGMVGSRQLAGFVAEAEARGAKIVLVGDHEQLQAIGAGAPFRAIAEAVGHAELGDIRRQRSEWQRAASVAFATHRTGEGLAAYAAAGAIRFLDGGAATRAAIVADALADRTSRPEGSRVVLAHRRVDVAALNVAIRSGLQAQGILGQGDAAGELAFATREGARAFVSGDRMVFLENDRGLGVKNGMLGTVEAVAVGRISVRLDGPAGGVPRRVEVPTDVYTAFDHGYATTIHKSQGATVDRAFVLASATLDRHLTYVAMTRHRDAAGLYADAAEFGVAVPVAAGTALPERFVARLSRAGTKETTLDYAPTYAAQRGIAERLGIASTIALAPDVVDAAGAAAPRIQRGMFDGLKLSRTGPVAAVAPAMSEPAPVVAEARPPVPVPAPLLESTLRIAEPADAAPLRPVPVPPLLPAQTVFARTPEAQATAAADAAIRAHAWELEAVYRDPRAALQRIWALAGRPDADLGGVSLQIRNDPEAFGELLGRTRRLFGPDRARKAVLGQLLHTAYAVGRGLEVWQHVYRHAMTEETARRVAAGVEIPGLSANAQDFLARYRAAKRADQPTVVARVLATPGGRAVLGEFTAVKTAGDQRVQAYKIDEDRAAGSITHMFARVPELTPAQGAAIGELVVTSRGIDRHRFELEYTQERTLRRGLDREGPSLGR